MGNGDAISRALRSVAAGGDQTEKRWSMKGKACATRPRRALKHGHGYSPSPSDTVWVPVDDVHYQGETIFLAQHSSKTLAIGQCEVSQRGLTPRNSPCWLRWVDGGAVESSYGQARMPRKEPYYVSSNYYQGQISLFGYVSIGGPLNSNLVCILRRETIGSSPRFEWDARSV